MAALMEWPEELIPSEMNVSYRSNTSVFESPFNKSSQSVTFPGSKFTFNLQFNDLNEDEIDLLNVVIVSLNGPGGKIKLRDFSKGYIAQDVLGDIRAVKLMDSKTLDVKGFLLKSQRALKAGAYVTVNHQLMLLSKDVVTTSDGSARLTFANVLRNTSVAPGAKVYTSPPYGIFKLQQDENGGSRTAGISGNFSLSFEEEIYVI